MRYAIVSDLHANLAAWNTVLTDIADVRADTIICLGDVVGYGPDPVEVLESVYRVVRHTLLGNHDAAVCGRLDPVCFSPRAQAAVRDHRDRLAPAGLAWLRGLPLTLARPGFRCAHGDFAAPEAFHYILAPEDALPSWRATQEQLLFVGHSHLPGIYVIGASGAPHFLPPCDFELEPGKRYLVNPGSVGYPRVGVCRSSYCVYDDAARTVCFRELPFDGDGYCAALRRIGLEADPWLLKSSRLRLPGLRTRLAFGKTSGTPHTQDISESGAPPAQRRHWSLRYGPFFVLAVLLGTGLYALQARRQLVLAPLASLIPPDDRPALIAYPTVPGKNLLPPLPDRQEENGSLPGWRYAVEHLPDQHFETGLRNGTLTLRIRHATHRRVQLESPLINLAGTRNPDLRLSGQVHKGEGFSGTVFYQMATYVNDANGEPKLKNTAPFELRDARGKDRQSVSLSRKIKLARQTSYVRFKLEAAFSGELEIEQPTLAAEQPKENL